jgi:hypothetical protein
MKAMLHNYKFVCIANAILILVAYVGVFGQQKSPYKILQCDDAVSHQDFVVSETLDKLKLGLEHDGPALIVILRQSVDETSQKLLRERLYNIDQYFLRRGSRLESNQVLIAVGNPVKGNGRIEYYLNGRLLETILFPKRGFICHECCGPDDRYFPDKSKKRVRKKLN